jgi:hypothetical protein
MSLKHLLGLDDLGISDTDIMAKIKEAYDHDLDVVEFLKEDGSKVVVRLPHIDFAHHMDPWDGKTNMGSSAS